MLTILIFADLERHSLPHDIAQQARRELLTIQDLSGGHMVDREYGCLFILEESDENGSVESVLGRPFCSLSFEGVRYQDGVFVGYLSGGGNERLDVLICPERLLTPAWKMKLLAEI